MGVVAYLDLFSLASVPPPAVRCVEIISGNEQLAVAFDSMLGGVDA